MTCSSVNCSILLHPLQLSHLQFQHVCATMLLLLSHLSIIYSFVSSGTGSWDVSSSIPFAQTALLINVYWQWVVGLFQVLWLLLHQHWTLTENLRTLSAILLLPWVTEILPLWFLQLSHANATDVTALWWPVTWWLEGVSLLPTLYQCSPLAGWWGVGPTFLQKWAKGVASSAPPSGINMSLGGSPNHRHPHCFWW